MKSSSSYAKIVLCLLLLALIVLAMGQIYVQRGYIHRWLVDTYRSRTLDAMERSAVFMLDRVGADFLEFIKANTPDNGPVIVPKPTISMLREQSVMQFFLMPRGIPSCRCGSDPLEYSDACIKCLREPNHTVPAVGDFPDPEVMDGYKQFVPFPEADELYKGIYISLDADPVSTPLLQSEPSRLSAAFLLDILVFASLLLSGALIIHAVHPGLALMDTWLLALPISSGFLTFTAFLLGWAGLRMSLLLYISIWMFLTLAALLLNMKRKSFPFPQRFPPVSLSETWKKVLEAPLHAAFMLSAAVISISLLIITLGRGYSLFDGIANWALKGYAIAYENSILAGANWGGHGLSYPQNIHHMIALFKYVDNDILPGSKLIFTLFSVTTAFSVYRFWRRHHTPKLIASAGLLLLLTIPEIYRFSTYGWSNIIFSSYLVTGSIFLGEGFHEQNPPDLTLGSLLLGFAGWTRPEGIGFSIAIAAGMILLALINRKRSAIKIPSLFPAVLIPMIWMIFAYPIISGDEIGNVLNELFAVIQDGAFNFNGLKVLLPFAGERLTNFKVFGAVFPILLVFGPLLLLVRSNVRRTLFTLILSSAVISFLIPHVMFFLAYFDKDSSYRAWLGVSYDRALFPGTILLLVSLILLTADLNLPSPFHRTSVSGRTSLDQ